MQEFQIGGTRGENHEIHFCYFAGGCDDGGAHSNKRAGATGARGRSQRAGLRCRLYRRYAVAEKRRHIGFQAISRRLPQEEGNLRCEVVQRLEQPNQFVTLQIWKDRKSFDAHAGNPAATALRDKLRPMLESPYDERVHLGLSVAPPQPTPSGRPTYVVTHVDVIPPRAGDAVALLGQIADASRKEAANSRFEVLQQTNRNNHFSIVEIWPNRKVFEARAATPGVIQFRNQLQPMIGALYDQRLYKILD